MDTSLKIKGKSATRFGIPMLSTGWKTIDQAVCRMVSVGFFKTSSVSQNEGMIMNGSTDIFEKCRNWDEAKKVKAAGIYPYFRPIESTAGSSVVTHGKRRVMIGSKTILGLTHHPRVQAASKAAIDKFGTGCTGSRFLNGNLSLHEDLEKRLAKYLGKEAVLVFSTGFLSNQGALSALVGRSDVIYCDRENHASIIEGTRVAMGDTVKFRHNNMEDLERVLSELVINTMAH